MTMQHRELAAGRWRAMGLMEQLANVGSEVERAINWQGRNQAYAVTAAERGLELLWLTIDDPRNRGRLRELTRLYEVLVDYFFGENQYRSSDELWRRYFGAYTWAVRAKT